MSLTNLMGFKKEAAESLAIAAANVSDLRRTHDLLWREYLGLARDLSDLIPMMIWFKYDDYGIAIVRTKGGEAMPLVRENWDDIDREKFFADDVAEEWCRM